MYLEKTAPRVEEFFGFDWNFCHQDDRPGGEGDRDLSNYRPVQLPHDWSVEYPFDENAPTCGSGGYVKAGTGWYKKLFTVSPESKGKKVSILFDGAYMCTKVWLNGELLGEHIYGYTPFGFDVTGLLRYGEENLLTVCVDNSSQPNSRWYTGSGITRDVWIKAVNADHVETFGTFVRTESCSEKKAIILADTTVTLGSGSPLLLKTALLDNESRTVAAEALDVTESGTASQRLEIASPRLWSHESPYLYTMISVLERDGEVLDRYETRFGVRTVEFDPDRGFLINGSQVKLNGVCIHHDGGSVGAAVPPKMWRRRLEKLREMGVNAIRASHNPPDSALLDICDEMGLYVMDEAFDEWGILKAKAAGSNTHESKGYSQWFREHHVADIEAMLYRDRNHPSIVIWSIGNEVPEQTHPEGHLIAKELQDICHQLDPTRLATQANDQIAAEPKPATKEFLDTLDVVGYNYTGRWRTRAETLYDDDKRANPGWRMLGTENPSGCGKRGEYKLEREEVNAWRQMYFSAPVAVGKLLRYTMTHDYVAGDFMWTGIDYLGEAHWPDRSSSPGPLDTCAFPKDMFYFYQSVWRKDQPVLHLLPHWNVPFEQGTIFPVLCYTNCESAELFVNGKSYGKKSSAYPSYGMTEIYGHYDKKPIAANTDDMFLSWDVPYEPGMAEVVGYDGEEEVCRYAVSTAGKPVAIRAAADTGRLLADGRDIAHIEISLVDEAGRLNPVANNRISVKVEGAAHLIGLDNGKPDSLESFKGESMAANGGLLLAVIQAAREEGLVTVTVSGEGLAPCKLELVSK